VLAVAVVPTTTAIAQDAAPRSPSRASGAWVARIAVATVARPRAAARHGGRPLSPQTAWSQQQQSLLVLDSTVREGRRWLKLLLPSRPNGSTGWVASERVVLTHTRWWVDIRTGTRRVTIYHRGERLRSFRAVVGAPETPTPLGLAAIYERNRQPDPTAFLGPWALPLTAMSNVLENYGGGPGRVAIHGRAGESLRDPLGTARSHGCIRVENRRIAWLARRLRAGTPVRIRR
jgi:lipoprotein-anchoring transpeptidase ErfK/SrfK